MAGIKHALINTYVDMRNLNTYRCLEHTTSVDLLQKRLYGSFAIDLDVLVTGAELVPLDEP